jgi:hypothetical protein
LFATNFLRVRRPTLVALLTAISLALLVAGTAARAATTVTVTAAAKTVTVVASNAPVLVTSQSQPPRGYRLNAAEVERIARRNPTAAAELRRHPHAIPYEYTKGPGRWQVSWFSTGTNQKELLQVYVDDASGKVTEAWTGFQVAWTMARGYPGAFGRQVNAWYVWIPMCLLFMAPFLPWRRPRARPRRRRPLAVLARLIGRPPRHPAAAPESAARQSSSCRRRGPPGAPPQRRRWSLLHIDLAVLLGFSISLAFFNHAMIGLSVPLVYPFLLYLLARMLLLAFGKGVPREPLRVSVPRSWLVVGIVFLVGFRIGLNVIDSNVIDVGYAGVIGADRILHDKPLYGDWPSDNASGDTYGPVNYYAYVPFRAIFGWSRTWDALPAAHAAAIFFDLMMLLALFMLGRRIRGPSLGIVLAYAWAAYPFSLYALSSNTNDTLVGLLVVLALWAITSAPARGVAGALAGLTKFAPLALAPLLLRGTGEAPRRRSIIFYVLAYGLTVIAAMLPVALNHDLHAFWQDSVSYQSSRVTPFSVWGLWGGLDVAQQLVQGAGVGLAVALAFFPARRGIVEVAALGAAILIALQLGVNYWLYPYIVWFFPLVIVALFASHPRAGSSDSSGGRSLDVFEPQPSAPLQIAVLDGSADARRGQQDLLDRVGPKRL